MVAFLLLLLLLPATMSLFQSIVSLFVLLLLLLLFASQLSLLKDRERRVSISTMIHGSNYNFKYIGELENKMCPNHFGLNSEYTEILDTSSSFFTCPVMPIFNEYLANRASRRAAIHPLILGQCYDKGLVV